MRQRTTNRVNKQNDLEMKRGRVEKERRDEPQQQQQQQQRTNVEIK